MGDAFVLFLVIIAILAALTRETFVVVLIYLFGGVTLIGNWWIRYLLEHLVSTRIFDRHAFPGERIPVRLAIRNPSWLPAVWLRVQDYFPTELADTNSFAEIISLSPHQQTEVQYNLRAHKRGLYSIGPLQVTTGDLLGITGERQTEGSTDTLTIYPRIVQFTNVALPSYSPMGTMRQKQPIFEDPTRPMGKRDYQTGDSLRRIDWKASASSGKLQTKIFEPSIALETMLFLNLNLEDYHWKTRYQATELAITVAASLANWVTAKRQSSGLLISGADPLAPDGQPAPIPARKGRQHLMRILDILARIRAADTEPVSALLRRHRVHLPWGTTIILISGTVTTAALFELHQAQRGGLNPVLVLCGEHPDHHATSQHARVYGIPTYVFLWEKDLDIWRK